MYLLIDNFDSFTFNLVQYLGELGAKTIVHRNNAISVDEAIDCNPRGIVLSPGPCGPDKAGICPNLVLAACKRSIPLLGVCLGHQSIAYALGGRIVQHDHIVHGKTSTIMHDNTGLFSQLPPQFTATRYHSLVIERASLPPALIVNGWTENKTIMAIMHRTLPVYGVQFHPESIVSEHGHAILRAFINLCES